jgi:hypothetical protein
MNLQGNKADPGPDQDCSLVGKFLVEGSADASARNLIESAGRRLYLRGTFIQPIFGRFWRKQA